MPGVQLLPAEGGEAIDVPDASTVIGRGPFLEVTDKRVSRSHALLEVIDRKLHLTPTHTNPCFFRKGGKGKQVVLQRDLRQSLEEGDMFGLLPDHFFYTVTYCDSPVNGRKSNTGSDRVSPVKREPEPHTPVKKGKNRVSARKAVEEEEDDVDEASEKMSIVSVIRADGKNVALPLTSKRELPAWMIQLSHSSGPASNRKQAAGKAQGTAKRAAPSTQRAPPKKKNSDEDFLDDEEEKPERRKAAKTPRTTAKRKGNVGKKFIDDDEEEDEKPARKSSRADVTPGRRPRRAATQKRASYVDEVMLGEDFDDSDDMQAMGDSDSDFKMDENKDADSGSDWEKRRDSQKTKKPTRQTSVRKGRKRKAQKNSSSEDDFEESDVEYIPRPSKRRGGTAALGRKVDNSEDDEEEEVKKEKKTTAAKTPGKKKKTPCYYGAKCYRRNPDHFKQFSHPGDSDEESEDEGTSSRARKAKDTKPTKPAATKASKKKTDIDDEEDDDGLPNSYDYNDSFINDASQSLSQSQFTQDGSSEEEELEDLKKEAKSFVRNKKMMKPV